jgi:hypothetical protein
MRIDSVGKVVALRWQGRSPGGNGGIQRLNCLSLDGYWLDGPYMSKMLEKKDEDESEDDF